MDILALLFALGIIACGLAVVPTRDAVLQRTLARAQGWATLLVTLASFGILVSRTMELDGGVLATLWTDMALALKVTHYGHIWLLRVPALVALWIACGGAWHRPGARWTGWLALMALALIVLTRSDTGHPADHGDFTFAVWIDWLHVLAAGAWVGSLFGMTLLVFPRLRRRGPAGIRDTAMIFQRLSTLCGVALGVLLAAGIYTATQQLGAPHDLWTSRYGLTLSVKVALVVVMIAIGAHNRYVKLPRLTRAAQTTVPIPSRASHRSMPAQSPRTASVRQCARAVLLESLLGLAVIAAAAYLIHTMPPADMPHTMSVTTTAVHGQAGVTTGVS